MVNNNCARKYSRKQICDCNESEKRFNNLKSREEVPSDGGVILK